MEEFLKELTELSKKYHLAVEGCGCCNSPYLKHLNPDQLEAGRYEMSSEGENITWVPTH